MAMLTQQAQENYETLLKIGNEESVKFNIRKR